PPTSFELLGVALDSNCNGPRVNEGRADSIVPVFRQALVAIAGHCCYQTGLQIHDPDAAIIQVGQIEPLAARIEGSAIDIAESSLGRRAAIAAESCFARAGDDRK